MAGTKTLLSAEQFMESFDGKRAELVQGEVIEMAPVGPLHGKFVMRLGSRMLSFVEARKAGEVWTEVAFLLRRDPDQVRAPDIAFIASSRISQAWKAFFDGAPDLAVEVLSPDDRASDVLQKIREYLSAGTRLVWVVDPHNRTVTAHHPDGRAHTYSDAEQVGGEDVLAAFSFTACELFDI